MNSKLLLVKNIMLLILFVVITGATAIAQNLKLVQDSAGNCGYKNRKGDLVIPYKYRLAKEFSEGLAAVYENGKYGFIDENDKLIIPYKYTIVLFNFSEGVTAVKLNNKWGYIDKSDKPITPFEYDFSYGFDEGMAAVQQQGKWGFINKKGKLVIPCKYTSVYSFREGLVAVKLNNKWGYINKIGDQIIPFEYDEANSFYQGLAVVQPIQNKGYGYINQKGIMVIPTQFTSAYAFDENEIALVSTITKSNVYIDKSGKIINLNEQTSGRGKYRLRSGEVYEGEILNGKRNGKGRNIWSNGDIYEGDWKDDKITGSGKKILVNGNSYEGEWLNNSFNGKGIYRWMDGAVYEGDWVSDNMNGNGKLTWANGVVYNGAWFNNNMHGKGILTSPKGQTMNGEWINGVFNGIVKQTTSEAIKTNSADIAAQKAISFRNAGNYTAALPEVQKALKLEPNNFLALFVRGILYAEYEKNNAKAITYYSKAILVNANNFRPYIFRAYSMVDSNLLQNAQKDVDKAISLNNKCFDCYTLRSYIFGKQKKWAAARDEAKIALNLKPNSEKAKSLYEMYKNFADPETIDATPTPRKTDTETNTNNSFSTNFLQNAPIELSKIKYMGGDDEDEYKENNAYNKKSKTNLSQSDMNNIIKNNIPTSSTNESNWDKWFRDRDRQSNIDYKRKNDGYRGY